MLIADPLLLQALPFPGLTWPALPSPALLCSFDKTFAETAPQLAADYSVPELFSDDLFALLGDARPDYRWLIIGPHRSGSRWLPHGRARCPRWPAVPDMLDVPIPILSSPSYIFVRFCPAQLAQGSQFDQRLERRGAGEQEVGALPPTHHAPR